MSVEAMAWVWRNGPTDPTERLVLLAIADHADDHGWCYPSMARIAEKSCVTERGARGIVRRLEAGGWVVVKVGGGRGGKSRYCVLMGKNPEPETGNTIPGKANPEPHSRNTDARNPERGDTKPGTSVPPNHQGTIKEPSTTAREAKVVVDVEKADPVSEASARRDEVLAIMGLDGCIKPDGKTTGLTNDMAELPKWDAMGLTRSEQDAKISEMLEKQRAKQPGFLPNTWRWFTTGMADLAAAKGRTPTTASQPVAFTDPDAEAERTALMAELERLRGSNSDTAFDRRRQVIDRLKELQSEDRPHRPEVAAE